MKVESVRSLVRLTQEIGFELISKGEGAKGNIVRLGKTLVSEIG